MRQTTITPLGTALFFLYFLLMIHAEAEGKGSLVSLPKPDISGNLSVEQALQSRKSVRSFSREPLLLSEISQLLWAGQGVNRKDGKRTAPSAGALYPLELYLVAGRVHGLDPGVYHYIPEDHELELIYNRDQTNDLFGVSLKQSCIQEAAALVVIAGVYRRTSRKYGDRAYRYVHIETGHAAQNISLQAESLGLGSVTIGAFDDDGVKRVLRMKREESPLYIIPMGRPR
jgi:SagB-type dehydrogenase family enzyme